MFALHTFCSSPSAQALIIKVLDYPLLWSGGNPEQLIKVVGAVFSAIKEGLGAWVCPTTLFTVTTPSSLCNHPYHKKKWILWWSMRRGHSPTYCTDLSIITALSPSTFSELTTYSCCNIYIYIYQYTYHIQYVYPPTAAAVIYYIT